MIEPVPSSRPLVLVADDDEDILTLVTFRLERAGCVVVKARNGDEALRVALEQVPDLAVLDVTMPGLDGYSVTRELRLAGPTSTMPIILLTARAQEADVARGLAAGADEYIRKPFDAHDLRERVERLLNRSLAAG
jgi:DNA-binding response OmpR family regulator